MRPPTQGTTPLLHDRFEQRHSAGRVVGQVTPGTPARLGIDVERVVSIDNGAARFAPLLHPGWGRSALTYGPYQLEPGITLAVQLLNGHHASQSFRVRRLHRRLEQWAKGSMTRPVAQRLPRLLTERRRTNALRRVRGWALHGGEPGSGVQLTDNLVCGFFTSPSPSSIADVTAGFVVTSTSNGNGTLSVVVDGARTPVIERLTNVPMTLVVVIREDSALFAVASLDSPPLDVALVAARPVAVTRLPRITAAYPGVEQVVAGETGFSVDTRVYDVVLSRDESAATWHGLAAVADSLEGTSALDGSTPDIGPAWRVSGDALTRSPNGLVATGHGIALADPAQRVGLLEVCVDGAPRGGLVWRAADAGHHCRLELDGSTWRVLTFDGTDTLVATGVLPHCATVEIRDDGSSVSVFADTDRLVSADQLGLPTFGTAVGLASLGAGPLGLSRFQALSDPLRVAISEPLRALPMPSGDVTMLEDDFRGAGDLATHTARSGQPWRRELGAGAFELGSEGGLVVADAPDRTLYTVAWPAPTCADLSTRILPVSGVKAQCRAGLAFYQDPDNYVVFNIWKNTRADGAASLSSFFMIDGFEDVYDAVWVNVGDRVRWDAPCNLRVAFDGMHYLARINGEAVLWRSLRDVYPRVAPLRIERVGIVANWEWGLDTGSRFLELLGSTDRSSLVAQQGSAPGSTSA